MEYKTDKRTKNLTLRDIHVGDWVQVWSETTERYSPPLKITQICDDGTVYLVGSDEECPKRHECKRYTTYKQDRWLFNHVMKGCIDGTLFIKETHNET